MGNIFRKPKPKGQAVKGAKFVSKESDEPPTPNNNPSAATGATGASPTAAVSQPCATVSQPSATYSQPSAADCQPSSIDYQSSTAGDNRTHHECEEDRELTPDRPAEESDEPPTLNNNPSAATGATGASPTAAVSQPCATVSQPSSIGSQPASIDSKSSTTGDNRTHHECEEDRELTPDSLVDLPTENTSLPYAADNHPPTTGTPPFEEANQPPQRYTQTTSCESEDDKKLKPGDLLEKLWEDQYLKDDLAEALDFEHLSNIRDHRHLAQEFDIPKEVRDSISGLAKTSPSEQLIENLQTTMPGLMIKDLCEKLKEGKAFQTRRLLIKALEATSFKEKDSVFKLFDKNWNLKQNIIIQLDSKERWKQVADKLNISEEKWSSFAIDPKCDPAGNFFDVLRTQSPLLKTSKLKEHLRELEQNDMLDKLENIKDESLVSELSSNAALMCDVILPKLNASGNNLLYKLADRFKKDGYLKDIDIKYFKVSDSYESPTVKMMDYVVCCQETEYKIQDLVDRLENINRADCCIIISKYVKGLQYQDVGQDVGTAN